MIFRRKKAGFTMMELLVYMAILGIIVIVAGRAYSDSTRFRVRSQNILKATQEAENVATLFKSDVIQMGAKSSLEVKGTGGDDQFIEAEKAAKVHWADDDASSYNLTPGAEGGADALEFKRFRYDGQGKFVSVEQVRWFVENEELKRSCKTIDGTGDADVCPSGDPKVIAVASNVQEFQVWPATPGVLAGNDDDNQVFPPCAGGGCGVEFRMVPRSGDGDFMALTVSLDDSHKSVRLSGFSSNYLLNEDKIDESGVLVNQLFATGNADYGNSWKSACTAENFNLEAETEYEISFEVSDGGDADKMRMFVPGRDHMAVGFRYSKDGSRPGEIDDFLFYPPADTKGFGERKMRFSVPKAIEGVCLAFTFASYSPVAANGQLVISDLMLKKVDTFVNNKFNQKNFSKENKERVKAFRMKLRIARAGETGDVDIVVPTPSNGIAD